MVSKYNAYHIQFILLQKYLINVLSILMCILTRELLQAIGVLFVVKSCSVNILEPLITWHILKHNHFRPTSGKLCDVSNCHISALTRCSNLVHEIDPFPVKTSDKKSNRSRAKF